MERSLHLGDGNSSPSSTFPVFLRNSMNTGTLIVGLGNPYHGDDVIGIVVARQLYEIIKDNEPVDFLELSVSNFELTERIVGYKRVIVVDGLVDDEEEIGSVKKIEVSGSIGRSPLSIHTGGFDAALSLAKMMHLGVPEEISVYGIVIREPEGFSERLSSELSSKLLDIVREIAMIEFGALQEKKHA
ncbi:MAG: hydrogenase maturation protease [Bacteroidota bacterium]